MGLCRWKCILLLIHLIYLVSALEIEYIADGSQDGGNDGPMEAFSLEAYRAEVGAWLERLNRELDDYMHEAQELSWQRSVNISKQADEKYRQFHLRHSKWNNEQCQIARSIRLELLDTRSRRMLKNFCKGFQLTPEQAQRYNEISREMTVIYASTRVNLIDQSFRGEPDLAHLMIGSRDYFELLWAWSEWRRAVGPPLKPLYAEFVRYLNIGAQSEGYKDIGESWKAELETPNLEQVVDDLYRQVEPLYVELHAYARGKLVQLYGDKLISPVKPIPAHVLGNMWAQNWLGIYPMLKPEGATEFAVTSFLKSHNMTVMKMVQSAQQYFLSLGFDPLPETFWNKSQFVKPTDGHETSCHGSAMNLFKGDVRFMMCAKVAEDDFITTHHEMGHLYYYLSYQDQPHLFQSGANSAFHEAVGDSIVYAVMGTLHNRNQPQTPDPLFDISFLLHQAVLKIPLLPFSLVMEKWRWNVFNGNIGVDEYNTAWWKLRTALQGVLPPVKRSEADFDPGAKYHIPDNTPYIRYFIAGLLQVQFLDALCEAAGQGPRFGQPLHKCDLYGSEEAGKRFRAMLSMGSSEPWQKALEALTNGRTNQLSAEPLLEYYKPLYHWLKEQNRINNFTLGWDPEYKD